MPSSLSEEKLFIFEFIHTDGYYRSYTGKPADNFQKGGGVCFETIKKVLTERMSSFYTV